MCQNTTGEHQLQNANHCSSERLTCFSLLAGEGHLSGVEARQLELDCSGTKTVLGVPFAQPCLFYAQYVETCDSNESA